MTGEAMQRRFEAARARTAPRGLTARETIKSLGGLEFLRRLAAGELPGSHIGSTAGFFLDSVEHGRAVFIGQPTLAYYNPIGSLHGGWISALLDSCMACAVQSTVDAGFGYTTAELKINFVRPVLESTGIVEATGTIIHPGRQIATAEGRLVDADGKLLAHGTTTCFIFPL